MTILNRNGIKILTNMDIKRANANTINDPPSDSDIQHLNEVQKHQKINKIKLKMFGLYAL